MKDINAKATGLAIKDKRKKLKLTQKELADKLGVEPQTISKWERGQGMPDYGFLCPLIDIFSCTLNDILIPSDAVNMENAHPQEQYLPLVLQGNFSNDPFATDSEKTKYFKNQEYFHKEKLKAKIKSVFGIKYADVYNEKFLFKGLFKKRHKKDYEDTLSQGMHKDKLDNTPLGIKAPWLYIRAFFFLAICTAISIATSLITGIPSTTIFFGSILFVIPLVVFLFESNFSRNISIFQVLTMFLLGGISSILLSLILYGFSKASDIVTTIVLAPLIEESAKFAIAILFISIIKPKNLISGLLVGFSVGAGFDVFETMQYGTTSWLAEMIGLDDIGAILTVMTRSIFSLGVGHHYWTAIVSGIYVLCKKDVKFHIKDVFHWKVLLALLYVIVLHMIWNSKAYIPVLGLGLIPTVIVTMLSVTTVILLINVGIAQSKMVEICDCYEEDIMDEKTAHNGEDDEYTFNIDPIID